MKTAIVTGANSGIGKQTSKSLAENGYRVVMICRNREKADSARREIIAETGNDQIDILICDLSLMHQIEKTADTVRESYSQIDRLVNNAGILPDGQRKETEEGLELTFAVNHMAYFLLTKELMPILEETPSARVVNVASDAHRYGEFNPDNLQLERGYSTSKAYGNSKLFNIMFTSQLAKEIEGKDISAFSLHPGVVNTNFAADSDSWFAKFFNLGRLFMRSPEKGAETSVYLCLEPDIEHLSGSYFRDKQPVKKPNSARSDEDCKRLWDISNEIVDRTT
ncbi:SDR family oxidoreductase [Rhodohalobacter sp. 8-1]|uniref:SDR family oxidoreductase n=1 Tax=Rhodohalobacter sp. 8-1 TaxID=3131972 RepID=UPI0030EF467B